MASLSFSMQPTLEANISSSARAETTEACNFGSCGMLAMPDSGLEKAEGTSWTSLWMSCLQQNGDPPPTDTPANWPLQHPVTAFSDNALPGRFADCVCIEEGIREVTGIDDQDDMEVIGTGWTPQEQERLPLQIPQGLIPAVATVAPAATLATVPTEEPESSPAVGDVPARSDTPDSVSPASLPPSIPARDAGELLFSLTVEAPAPESPAAVKTTQTVSRNTVEAPGPPERNQSELPPNQRPRADGPTLSDIQSTRFPHSTQQGEAHSADIRTALPPAPGPLNPANSEVPPQPHRADNDRPIPRVNSETSLEAPPTDSATTEGESEEHHREEHSGTGSSKATLIEPTRTASPMAAPEVPPQHPVTSQKTSVAERPESPTQTLSDIEPPQLPKRSTAISTIHLPLDTPASDSSSLRLTISNRGMNLNFSLRSWDAQAAPIGQESLRPLIESLERQGYTVPQAHSTVDIGEKAPTPVTEYAERVRNSDLYPHPASGQSTFANDTSQRRRQDQQERRSPHSPTRSRRAVGAAPTSPWSLEQEHI